MKKFNTILTLAILFTFMNEAESQTFTHGQFDVFLNSLRSGITIKNEASSSASQIEMYADNNQSFQIGMTNSANTIFGDANTVFLNNKANTDMVFRNNNDIHMRLQNDGDLSLSGGDFIMFNNSGSDAMALKINDTNGGFAVLANSTSGNTQLFVDDDAPNVGINNVTPITELHILQENSPSVPPPTFGQVISNQSGLTIESPANKKVLQYVDTSEDLNFGFEGIFRSFINNTDGKLYTATGNSPRQGGKSSGKDHLAKVNQLAIGSISDETKSTTTELGVDGAQLAKIFPHMVKKKYGLFNISNADFGLIALKAIQEQQVLIEKLTLRLDQLEKYK